LVEYAAKTKRIVNHWFMHELLDCEG